MVGVIGPMRIVDGPEIVKGNHDAVIELVCILGIQMIFPTQ